VRSLHVSYFPRVLDLATNAWQQLDMDVRPSPRCGDHSGRLRTAFSFADAPPASTSAFGGAFSGPAIAWSTGRRTSSYLAVCKLRRAIVCLLRELTRPALPVRR